jgi:hypothetical protein
VRCLVVGIIFSTGMTPDLELATFLVGFAGVQTRAPLALAPL